MEVTGALSVIFAAGLGALVVGISLMGSSEGLKVLVDPADSNAECVFATV